MSMDPAYCKLIGSGNNKNRGNVIKFIEFVVKFTEYVNIIERIEHTKSLLINQPETHL